jgi:triphosphoribosyl-dephospho-CoA synthase
LPIGQCATLACLLEATIPKPGNVHRGADFEDLSFLDLAVSAVAIGPAMDAAATQGPLGQTVLDAIQATRRLVRTNTNLGMVLLLGPLARVPRPQKIESGVRQVLSRLTSEDARCVYQAITIAEPGGLGSAESMDVRQPPPQDLLAAMRAAADRDLVARQYANGFHEVFQACVPWLREGLASGWTLGHSVVHTHVRFMHEYPDSLIARKGGPDLAAAAAAHAGAVLRRGTPVDQDFWSAVADLDFWLRSDGHRRNPGTTADMIAAGLFVLLRDGHLEPPFA